MYNPDYPSTGGNFLQYTYQPQHQQAQQNLYYYGGAAPVNPFNPMAIPADSRRNFGMAAAPMPNAAPGYQPTWGAPVNPSQTNNAIPEEQVVPFASYPPTRPMENINGGVPGMPAFNALVDSRRNMGATNTAVTSPWATPQSPNPVQPPMPAYDPYSSMYNGYGYPNVPPNADALFDSRSQFGFNKENGCWDNPYTSNRTIPMPAVDWKPLPENQVAPAPNPYGNPAYPVTQVDASWKEIAEKNWGTPKL